MAPVSIRFDCLKFASVVALVASSACSEGAELRAVDSRSALTRSNARPVENAGFIAIFDGNQFVGSGYVVALDADNADLVTAGHVATDLTKAFVQMGHAARAELQFVGVRTLHFPGDGDLSFFLPPSFDETLTKGELNSDVAVLRLPKPLSQLGARDMAHLSRAAHSPPLAKRDADLNLWPNIRVDGAVRGVLDPLDAAPTWMGSGAFEVRAVGGKTFWLASVGVLGEADWRKLQANKPIEAVQAMSELVSGDSGGPAYVPTSCGKPDNAILTSPDIPVAQAELYGVYSMRVPIYLPMVAAAMIQDGRLTYPNSNDWMDSETRRVLAGQYQAFREWWPTGVAAAEEELLARGKRGMRPDSREMMVGYMFARIDAELFPTFEPDATWRRLPLVGP